MLVIGLAGGTSATREIVAHCLRDRGGQQLTLWALGGTHYDESRARTMERALEGARKGRRVVRGMVFTHVLTHAEANVIRRHRGFLWHLTQPVSSVVPIQRGDLVVTPKEGGEGHYLDPLEALSEVLVGLARRGAHGA